MSQLRISLKTNRLVGQPLCRARPKAIEPAKIGTLTRAVAEPSSAVPFLSNAAHLKEWKPDSWKKLTALQQPEYPDKVIYHSNVKIPL